MKYYQREIKELRKQLTDSYNIDRITEIENEIKNKQMRIQELREEEQALQRISQEQSEALKTINREGDYEEKIREMNEQLRIFKKEYRELYYQQIESNKQLIDKHDSVMALDAKVKKMQK